MRRVLRLLLAAPLSIIVFLILWFGFRDEPGEAREPEPALAAAKAQTLNPSPPVEPPVPAAKPAADCMTLEQMEAHPLLLNEAEYRAAMSTTGSPLLPYVGLDEPTLLSLVEQDDSAAMAVMGARSQAVAHGLPPERADGFFTLFAAGERPTSNVAFDNGPKPARPADFSPEQRRAAESAYQWYWEAALHGRYSALTHAGLVRQQLGDNAVSMGWVSEEAHGALDPHTRFSLWPFSVYSEASMLLEAGELDSSILTKILMDIAAPTRSDLQGNAARSIVEEVRRQQKERGIEFAAPEAGTILTEDALRDSLCPGELERIP